MAERDELPPGWSMDEPDVDGVVQVMDAGCSVIGIGTIDDMRDAAWEHFGMTREDYLDMKSKAERCEAAEPELGLARQDAARSKKALESVRRELGGGEDENLWADAQELKERAEQRDLMMEFENLEIQDLRAQLAEVARERDALAEKLERAELRASMACEQEPCGDCPGCAIAAEEHAAGDHQ